MNLFAACPACEGIDWKPLDGGKFECEDCGYDCYPEEMELVDNSEENME